MLEAAYQRVSLTHPPKGAVAEHITLASQTLRRQVSFSADALRWLEAPAATLAPGPGPGASWVAALDMGPVGGDALPSPVAQADASVALANEPCTSARGPSVGLGWA